MKSFKRMMMLLFTGFMLFSTTVLAKGPKLSDLSNNQWLKFLANTVMLGAILFLVYIYAVPSEKDDKTKKGAIIIAVLALCALIAYQFMTDVWFWQIPLFKSLFHKKVLINVGVIATAMFVLMMLAQMMSAKLKEQMDKTAGKYTAIIIILLLTFNFALADFFDGGKIKTWEEVEPNYKYIWEKPDIQKIKLYLLGDSACSFVEDGRTMKYCYYSEGDSAGANGKGEPTGYGILRPPYIVVFFLSLLLLIWMFKTFKFMTDIDWLQYIFAFLLAAEFANKGVSFKTFATVAQIATIAIIQKSLKTADSNMKPWFAWGISAAVVGIITHYAFPKYQFAMFDWLFGMGFWWGLGIIIGVVALGGYIITKIMNKDKKEETSRWAFDLGTNIANRLKKGLLYSKRFKGLKKLVDKIVPLRLNMPDGEINNIFRELNVEFHYLMNYMLRLEVFNTKTNHIMNTEKNLVNTYNTMVSASHSWQSIFTEMNMFKFGTGYVKDSDGYIETAMRPVMARDCNSNRRFIASDDNPKSAISDSPQVFGCMAGPYLFYQPFKVVAGKNYLFGQEYKDGHKMASFPGNVDEKIKAEYSSFIASDKSEWHSNYGKLVTSKTARIKRYGMVNQVHSQRSMILDQYRMTGYYDHSYLFVHPEAVYDVYEADINDNFKDTTIKRTPTKRNVGKIDLIDGKHYHEMTKNNFIVQDINEIFEARVKRAQGKTVPTKFRVRKVPPESIVWGDFRKIMNWQAIEWQAFFDDLRDGRHHTHSRKASDYTAAHKNYDFRYENVKRSARRPGRDDPIFDREGMKDTGAFMFPGRKNYWGDTSEINKKGVQIENPFPGVCTMGLTQYLKDIVVRMMENDKEAFQQLQRFVWDSGSEGSDKFARTPAEGQEKA